MSTPIAPTPSGFDALQPPDWIEGDFILRSPNLEKVVYNQCDSGESSTDVYGRVSCADKPQFVIYSFVEQRVIQVLPDITLGMYERAPYLDQSVSWSPTGRYLAYLTTSSIPPQPPIKVYDTIERRYLLTQGSADYSIDYLKALSWSPDETKLVFWVNRSSTSDFKLIQQLAIFNTQTGDFQLSDQTYVLNTPSSPSSTWSPNSEQFAFVDANNSLVVVDVNTGASSSSEGDISSIIAIWKNNPALHTSTPTPTPTATTTPR